MYEIVTPNRSIKISIYYNIYLLLMPLLCEYLFRIKNYKIFLSKTCLKKGFDFFIIFGTFFSKKGLLLIF